MRRNHTLLGILTAVAVCSTMLPVASFAAAGQKFTVTNGDNRHAANSEGYSYEIWLDDNPGASGSMTLGKGGAFDTEWSAEVSKGNFLARRGMTFDVSKKASEYDNITLDYAAEYSASQKGNSRLCVYGWFRNGPTGDKVAEYYIIEDWVNWCPKPEGASKTVIIDGAEYEIFTIDHYGPTIKGGGNETFPQLFSIRKNKRTSGTITVSDHFKAWDAAGLPIYNLTEVALNVEGWESSGRANVSKLELEVGGTPKPTEAPKPTEPPTEPASGYYMNEDFESGKGDWSARGDNMVVVTPSNGVLNVTGRSDNWHGACTTLSTNTYIPGNAYSFSVMVNPAAADTAKLTLQYKDASGKENYDTVAEQTAAAGAWTQLANTSYTIPAGASDMVLYVELDGKTTNFSIDNAAIATKGTVIAASGESAAKSSKGDVNSDGEVNIMDIIALQKHMLGVRTDINGDNADMNDDNVIDVFDLNLLKYAVVHPTTAPVQAKPETETQTPTQAVAERKAGYYYNTQDASKIDTSKPMVAFAFDDGPISGADANNVKRIQDAVSNAGGHATFFYWGERIAGNEQEIKRAQSLGFEIANHTWTHTDLRTLDANGIKNEIGKCADKLKEITGQEDFLVRPPFLRVDEKVQQNCGAALVNCGIDSGDWDNATTQDIINKFMGAAQNGTLNGQVLLMHENYDTTATAVEYLCQELPKMGYQIVSVGEMFKAKGIDMKYGNVYNNAP